MSTEPDHPPVELPPLTEAQIAEIELEHEMNTPVRIPVRWRFVPVELDAPDTSDTSAVVMTTQTPIGTTRLVLTRSEALEFAAALRKAAHRGPQLHLPGGGA